MTVTLEDALRAMRKLDAEWDSKVKGFLSGKSDDEVTEIYEKYESGRHSGEYDSLVLWYMTEVDKIRAACNNRIDAVMSVRNQIILLPEKKPDA